MTKKKESKKNKKEVKKTLARKSVKVEEKVAKKSLAIKKKIRTLKGSVVRAKSDKTLVVEINRVKKHPVYKKFFYRSSRLKVHNLDKNIKEGDKVVIKQIRPISKEKKWLLVRKVN